MSSSPDVLDHAAWYSLTGAHASFSDRVGSAIRYHPDVSPFAAVAPDADPSVWDDLLKLIGPGQRVALTGSLVTGSPPPGWEILGQGQGVQMVDTALVAAPDPEAVALTAADVPDMLDLVGRTRPGPFLPRTVELGNYIGIRRDGVLIAMAGERIHPPGWTELSAVCTDAAFRGEGLATRLVRAVAAGIGDRGETPFLHAAATNTNAIRLYRSIGFTVRRELTFTFLRSPA